MNFKYLAVGKHVYGSHMRLNDDFDSNPYVDFTDDRFFDHWRFGKNGANITKIVLAMCLCNTVIPELDKNNKIEYQATSPDELAIAHAIKYFGVHFTKIDSNVEINSRGEVYKFKVLEVLEFDHERKMMSVIVEDEGGEKRIITKGADSSIFDRMSLDNDKLLFKKRTLRQL